MAIDKLFPPKIDNILPAFSSKSEYVSLGKLSDTQSDNPEIPYELGVKYVYEKKKFFYKANGEYTLDTGSLNTNRTYYEKRVNLKIPYWLNPSVGEADFDSLHYILKSATTNTELLSGKISVGVFDQEEKCYILNLQLPALLFTIGQYYKLQIAFQKNSDIGYYSNAGIVKYLSEPTLTITQSELREITGKFKDSKTREKVYSHSFNLYNEFNVLLESSGEILHNVNNDTSSTTSIDCWEITTDLQPDINYTVEYAVTTVNNFKISKTATLSYFETLAPRIAESKLLVENNYEEGYNRIYLRRFKQLTNPRICGNFILLRSSSRDNFSNWEKMFNFQIYDWSYNSNNRNFEIYKDYLIEQGVSYRYAIQAYSKHKKNSDTILIYSTKVKNDNGIIYSDFEDIFLYDGERQLKIRFNPKVGTFKQNLLESKVDTIGGKHPFFFRNGNVNYKEFSISGLVSMNSDLNGEFSLGEINYHPLPDEELRTIKRDRSPSIDPIGSYNNTELTSYNYQKEREFKLKVLEWLTNGKEKVLKTASEGNYIVRLMNTSLSPNDTLGRMLHTVTSTAYEVAEYNFNNLKLYGFINQKQIEIITEASRTLTGKEWYDIPRSSSVIIDNAIIYSEPKEKFSYKLKDGTEHEDETNVFGICDLSSKIKNIGLTSLKPKASSGWPIQSEVKYSYIRDKKNTNSWYWIDTATKKQSDSGVFTNTDDSITTSSGIIYGRGLSESIKDYINSKKSKIVSSFPYVVISRRSATKPTEEQLNNGYYCIYLNKEDVIENLYEEFKDDTSLTKKKIYRNLEDFCLGQGLKAVIHCPWKELEFNSSTSDYTYAI